MTRKDLSELTDQELLEEAKKPQLSPVTNAFFVGFMIAIVAYSVAKNTWGLLTLIPLAFIYGLVRSSKNNEALKKLLKERNLA